MGYGLGMFLHIFKKTKKKTQTLRQKPAVQSLQNSNDSDTGWDDTEAQQGRGEHVSGEEELPSVICWAANIMEHCGAPNLHNSESCWP